MDTPTLPLIRGGDISAIKMGPTQIPMPEPTPIKNLGWDDDY